MIFNIFFNIGLYHYLILAAILFSLGLFGILVSKNIIKILMCLEVMLVSININFIAFSNYTQFAIRLGDTFALFIMGISAMEVAIGLSIVVALFRHSADIDITKHTQLGGRK